MRWLLRLSRIARNPPSERMFWLGVAGFTVFHQAVRRKARAAGLDTTQ